MLFFMLTLCCGSLPSSWNAPSSDDTASTDQCGYEAVLLLRLREKTQVTVLNFWQSMRDIDILALLCGAHLRLGRGG